MVLVGLYVHRRSHQFFQRGVFYVSVVSQMSSHCNLAPGCVVEVFDCGDLGAWEVELTRIFPSFATVAQATDVHGGFDLNTPVIVRGQQLLQTNGRTVCGSVACRGVGENLLQTTE